MVLIGGASINEYGTGEGGKAGDQTGKEVLVEPWYLHEKGWIVVRAKDDAQRKLIAQNMRYACANDNIGYSFWDHCYTLMELAERVGWDCSKVDEPCETNCAKLVYVCVRYAGIPCEDFFTGNEVAALKATGKFDVLTDSIYTTNDRMLAEGDILVTKTAGHTVVVLEGGEGATPAIVTNCAWANMRKGSNVNTAVVDTLKNGTRVALLEYAKNGWGRIAYNGKTGYMAPLYLAELARAKVTGDCWLRTKAGTTKGKKIVVIPEGARPWITGEKEKVGSVYWYYCIYKGSEGWASGKYVKP